MHFYHLFVLTLTLTKKYKSILSDFTGIKLHEYWGKSVLFLSWRVSFNLDVSKNQIIDSFLGQLQLNQVVFITYESQSHIFIIKFSHFKVLSCPDLMCVCVLHTYTHGHTHMFFIHTHTDTHTHVLLSYNTTQPQFALHPLLSASSTIPLPKFHIPSISFQKIISLQETTAKYNKTRYNKTRKKPSYQSWTRHCGGSTQRQIQPQLPEILLPRGLFLKI